MTGVSDGEGEEFRLEADAEFWPCPSCRTELALDGRIDPNLTLELHDRLTPTGVAPVRATLHTADCTMRNHLAEEGASDRRTFQRSALGPCPECGSDDVRLVDLGPDSAMAPVRACNTPGCRNYRRWW